MSQSNDTSDSREGELEAVDRSLKRSYRFRAQSIAEVLGEVAEPVTGSIDADGSDSAQQQLSAMRLRVLSLEPESTDALARPIRGGDFLAFNQQLAYMTEAGLPLEQGLRLIGQDIRRGSLRATIARVADELKAGKGAAEAFAAHRGAFPPLYGAVLDAGVRSGNLPAVLMGLGRHLELIERLKTAIWRALAYPLVVFLGVLVMLGVIGSVMAPQFQEMFEEFDTTLPPLTVVVLTVARYMPAIAGGMVLLGIAVFGAFIVLRNKGMEQALIDRLLWIPLVGEAIRRNMLSRWCDALRLGLGAGLDLPGALKIAADTIGSTPLNRDTQRMVATLEQGGAIRKDLSLVFVPDAVPAAIELASHADDLPEMIANLGEMYQQQAEARVVMLHTLLGPAMLIFVAMIISLVIWALFLPMIHLMEWML